ncbi:hypothetical protein I6F07_03615 [Ensifer sp. IC4062]|nr:hypothetical protein [Ensifer sp. IC4062]MCA1439326.1 hypothetical protein [Ensifer sp. IC4062]
MALVLSKVAPTGNGKPVFHFAPETGIADILIERYAGSYSPADFSPDLYPWSKVPLTKVDLRQPLVHFPPQTVHGFVHSHVLEHIPGSIERIILEMNEAIAPGGFHFFQVPIEPGWYRENMDPNLPGEQRRKDFGQDDHFRMFGAMDFHERILRLFEDFQPIDLTKHIGFQELRDAAVPASSLSRLTGHSVFAFLKR